MKVRKSLRSLKKPGAQVIRRHGKVFVINKDPVSRLVRAKIRDLGKGHPSYPRDDSGGLRFAFKAFRCPLLDSQQSQGHFT